MATKSGRDSVTGNNSSYQQQSKQTPEKTRYDQFNLSKKMKIDTLEELHQQKGQRSAGSTSTDDQRYQEKYMDLTKQLKEFFEDFKSYAMREVNSIF